MVVKRQSSCVLQTLRPHEPWTPCVAAHRAARAVHRDCLYYKAYTLKC